MPHNQWTHVDDHASPALVELLDLTLTRPLAEYVAQHVVDAVENGSTHPRSFFSGVRGRQSQPGNNAKQVTFVLDVLSRSHTTMPTVLATLVYIDRVSPRLHIVCDDFAFERVFLGALIVARKFTHDCNYRCKHWASFTGLFGARDISRIEREFLEVLQFDLTFTEDNLLQHHDGLMFSSSPSSLFPIHRRRSLKSSEGTSHRDAHPPLFATEPHHSHFVSRRLVPSSSEKPSPSHSSHVTHNREETSPRSSSDGSSPESDDDCPLTPLSTSSVVPVSVPGLDVKKRKSILGLFRSSHHPNHHRQMSST